MKRDSLGGQCVLYDRECIDCGECDKCDLDPSKTCDNCGKCIAIDHYAAIKIDKIYTEEEVGGEDN